MSPNQPQNPQCTWHCFVLPGAPTLTNPSPPRRLTLMAGKARSGVASEGMFHVNIHSRCNLCRVNDMLLRGVMAEQMNTCRLTSSFI